MDVGANTGRRLPTDAERNPKGIATEPYSSSLSPVEQACQAIRGTSGAPKIGAARTKTNPAIGVVTPRRCGAQRFHYSKPRVSFPDFVLAEL